FPELYVVVRPPSRATALPEKAYPAPEMVMEAKVLSLRRSFVTAISVASAGKTRSSPDSGTPFSQLSGSDHEPLSAPVHVATPAAWALVTVPPTATRQAVTTAK